MSALFAAFGVNWHLLVIQAVNFVLLLVVLSYFLYKPVLHIIDERQKKIAEGIRKAEEASRHLAQAKEESEGIIGTAARDAEALSLSARTRADERSHEIVKAAESKANALMKDATVRAQEAQRQALLEGQREIARAAMLAAEKILATK